MIASGDGPVAGLTVTSAEACTAGAIFSVAVMLTLLIEDTEGAVNNPLAEIEPELADQLTAVLEVLLTVATNCCVPPVDTVALTGLTATLGGTVPSELIYRERPLSPVWCLASETRIPK